MRTKCEKMRVKEKIFSKNFCFLNFLPYLCIVILLRQRDPAKCRPSLNHSARIAFEQRSSTSEAAEPSGHRDSAESTPAHLHLPSSVTVRPQYDNSQRYVVSGA